MDTPEDTTPTDEFLSASLGEREEEGTASRVIGKDPWMRFDMWASRSWESADTALSLALTSDSLMDETINGRIVALFHASQIAKEFAEMTNPLMAVSPDDLDGCSSSKRGKEAVVRVMLDGDDFD